MTRLGDFWKFLATNFLTYKSSPNILRLCDYLQQITFHKRTCLIWHLWATFYSKIWTHWDLQRTGSYLQVKNYLLLLKWHILMFWLKGKSRFSRFPPKKSFITSTTGPEVTCKSFPFCYFEQFRRRRERLSRNVVKVRPEHGVLHGEQCHKMFWCMPPINQLWIHRLVL